MKILKRVGIVLAVLIPIALIAFLLLIPPLTIIPQEEFIGPTKGTQTDFSSIDDPVRKLFVQRGSYLVHTIGCTDCHTPHGEQGPLMDQYLSGGLMLANSDVGGIVSYNLTSDKETGIGGRSDAEIIRALRSGLFHDGRQMNYRAMPWAGFANMSEEDLRAVVAYLRTLQPVRNRIPAPPVTVPVEIPNGSEMFFPGNFGSPD